MEENESPSQQYTPQPEGEPKMEFKADADGSYHLTLKMKCYPDGAGGWVCF